MNQSSNVLNINQYLTNFVFNKGVTFDLFDDENKTQLDYLEYNSLKIPKYTNEFWTSQQRKANPLHEVSYRACFKPQLPRFFIQLLTRKQDIIYDPFSGRGTTVIEAALLGRNIIANDINPISKILAKPRILVPKIEEINQRLEQINLKEKQKSDIDLSMFFHPKTESEIVNLKNYLELRRKTKKEDSVDLWIRMIATNRLTGHSKGFFSVYTLPPNQAVTQERQKLLNLKRKQVPEYRNVKTIIIAKSISLLKGLSSNEIELLRSVEEKSLFISKDARETSEIADLSVQLTVTSPPFLDVIKYDQDNWLRCWFNNIGLKNVSKKITMSKTVDEWSNVMKDVFKELFRITKNKGWVAFEVGEVKNGKIKLEEYVIPLGLQVGFKSKGIMINQQIFTKTSNIWGVKNNDKGTNSNRILIFQK